MGGFSSGLLTGSVAFTGIVAVFIIIIMYLGYSTEVMAVGTKRFFVTLVLVFFVASVAVAALILFPDLLTQIYNFINQLGYR